jgi:hypothetical protein
MKTLSFIKPAFLCFIAVAMGTLSLKAQSTKNVAVSNFSAVSVSAGIELLITQGSSESAKIVANSDVIDEVEITTSGNTVKVGWKSNWGFKNHNNRNAKVYINYKKLNNISASSGSSVKTENPLKTDHLDASASSGASIDAKVECNDLEVSISSGASSAFTGKTTNLRAEASSGASANLLNLTAENATAKASSGASLKVYATKALETTASSGGDIRYKGDASLRNSSSRSGGVSKIN